MSEEVRTITVKGIELREDQGDGTRIEGIAVPFGQRIGLWRGAAESSRRIAISATRHAPS